MVRKLYESAPYGYDQNGDEIDESTIDELYRILEKELLPQTELARYVFGADNMSIDEDSFEYYATGSAWGANIDYDILVNVATGSRGNKFDLNKFLNRNYEGLRPDLDITDISFDMTIKVRNDDITVDIDTNSVAIDGDYTDYFAKRFAKIFDIDAIKEDIKTIAERDAYEIKIVLSNI